MITLTASDLPRFIACNGSRLIKPEFKPSYQSENETRDQGIAAHWLAEEIARLNRSERGDWVGKKAPNNVFISDTMFDHVTDYLQHLEKDGVPMLELDCSHGLNAVWQVNGRCDAISYNNGVLTVTDFKYGFRIVEPHLNWTLISHAVGFMIANPQLRVDRVNFCIFQPRQSHPDGVYRVWSIDRLRFGELHAQLSNALREPSDELNTGSHCSFCPKILSCPASRAATINAVDVSMSSYDEHAPDDVLGFELDQTNAAIVALKARLKAYEELAINRIRHGKIIQGYHVTAGEGRRKWNDGVKPEFVKLATSVDVSKPSEMITPTQAIKAAKTPAQKEAIKALSMVPSKGPKLIKGGLDPAKMFNKRK